MAGINKDRTFGLAAKLKQQYGFPDRPEFGPPSTVHEAEIEQLPLLQAESFLTSTPCFGTPRDEAT